jgi:hypothetical protein
MEELTERVANMSTNVDMRLIEYDINSYKVLIDEKEALINVENVDISIVSKNNAKCLTTDNTFINLMNRIIALLSAAFELYNVKIPYTQEGSLYLFDAYINRDMVLYQYLTLGKKLKFDSHVRTSITMCISSIDLIDNTVYVSFTIIENDDKIDNNTILERFIDSSEKTAYIEVDYE